ncbi:hypothetical protein Hdeb2414_s0005g00166771 [Helianthus debilis subsp. tardiflorus]
MWKNKPLGESRKNGQTSGTEMAFYSNRKYMNCTLAMASLSLSFSKDLISGESNVITICFIPWASNRQAYLSMSKSKSR